MKSGLALIVWIAGVIAMAKIVPSASHTSPTEKYFWAFFGGLLWTTAVILFTKKPKQNENNRME